MMISTDYLKIQSIWTSQKIEIEIIEIEIAEREKIGNQEEERMNKESEI